MLLYSQSQNSNPQPTVISGRKVSNIIKCPIKQFRIMNPHVHEMVAPEDTFETDSFKEILTKRSGRVKDKENMSVNNKHNKLKKINEETLMQKKKKAKKDNPIERGEKRKVGNGKSSTASLHRLFRNEKSREEKSRRNRKSFSPNTELKNYRSGPENKNYISNYVSKTNRELTHNRSTKALTERHNMAYKINTKSLQISQKQGKIGKDSNRDNKKEEEVKKVIKKRKNVSKVNLLNTKRTNGNKSIGKLEDMAKQFDKMAKKKAKKKIKTKNNKSSKEKKVIVSVNNSHSNNYVQRYKKKFEEDESSEDQSNFLSHKYLKKSKQKKGERLSFDPLKRKKKQSKKIKTQCLSPSNHLEKKLSEDEAAIKIQKVFKGYITRKYLEQFKTVMGAVITIQRIWRGHRDRKIFKQMQLEQNKMKVSRNLVIESPEKIHQLLHSSISKAQTPEVKHLTNLLEEILYEQEVGDKIKEKIITILNKEVDKSSARSSVKNHSQAQIQSERLFNKDINERKSRKSESNFSSPKLDKSHLLQSPELMVQNLLTIQQFHKQKLISNAHLQQESLSQLALKKIFSPRTHEIKKKQIQQRLQVELDKFENSMHEVLKSCRGVQTYSDAIMPFSGVSTPEHAKIVEECSPEILNSSQRKIQDLSMELLDYYDQPKKQESDYQIVDSSYQFIQDYLLNLFEFIRQSNEQFKEQFNASMRKCRNLSASILLKNMITITEQSDEEDMFKLPFYKHLQSQQEEHIKKSLALEFNQVYEKIQKKQSQKSQEILQVYLKMIVDCMNEALFSLRPTNYIFTEAVLNNCRSTRNLDSMLKNNEQIEEYTVTDNHFSFYFASAMEKMYAWGNLSCGMISTVDGLSEIQMMVLKEKKMRELLKNQADKEWIFYDQLLEIIVGIAEGVMDDILSQETMVLYR